MAVSKQPFEARECATQRKCEICSMDRSKAPVLRGGPVSTAHFASSSEEWLCPSSNRLRFGTMFLAEGVACLVGMTILSGCNAETVDSGPPINIATAF